VGVLLLQRPEAGLSVVFLEAVRGGTCRPAVVVVGVGDGVAHWSLSQGFLSGEEERLIIFFWRERGRRGAERKKTSVNAKKKKKGGGGSISRVFNLSYFLCKNSTMRY
jgi:hypothetical protein